MVKPSCVELSICFLIKRLRIQQWAAKLSQDVQRVSIIGFLAYSSDRLRTLTIFGWQELKATSETCKRVDTAHKIPRLDLYPCKFHAEWKWLKDESLGKGFMLVR